jgi:hypothetical protein
VTLPAVLVSEARVPLSFQPRVWLAEGRLPAVAGRCGHAVRPGLPWCA